MFVIFEKISLILILWRKYFCNLQSLDVAQGRINGAPNRENVLLCNK